MKGDTLASGGTSATFSGGQSAVDDPIKFNYTVAPEEPESDESWLAAKAVQDVEAHERIIAKGHPLNDRVLLRPITAEDNKRVKIADAFIGKPNIGEVVSCGEGVVRGNEFHPIPLQKGDVIQFGEYSAEDIEIDGEKLVSVSYFDCRYRF